MIGNIIYCHSHASTQSECITEVFWCWFTDRVKQKNWTYSIFLFFFQKRRWNLHLLSGEQHVSPFVDLLDENLCFPHAVVALPPPPPRMPCLQEIQLGTAAVGQIPTEMRGKMKGGRKNGRNQEQRKKMRSKNKSGIWSSDVKLCVTQQFSSARTSSVTQTVRRKLFHLLGDKNQLFHWMLSLCGDMWEMELRKYQLERTMLSADITAGKLQENTEEPVFLSFSFLPC